jgi:hypothetical protein
MRPARFAGERSLLGRSNTVATFPLLPSTPVLAQLEDTI